MVPRECQPLFLAESAQPVNVVSVWDHAFSQCMGVTDQRLSQYDFERLNISMLLNTINSYTFIKMWFNLMPTGPDSVEMYVYKQST